MRRFVAPLDKQERWVLCKRGGKGIVRPQVRHDGSAVGLQRVWKAVQSWRNRERGVGATALDMGSP